MTKIHNNNHRSHTATHLLRSLFLPVIAAVMSAVGLSSCIDEIEMGDGYIPEGETTVLMNVSFSPLVTQELNGAESRASVFEDNSVAPTGGQMDQISSLYLLFYSNSGNLVKSETVNLNTHKPELEVRDDFDAVDVNDPASAEAAQEKTYCVKNIPITLQNGLYRIFAVANIADFLTEYSEEIQTIESLRDIKLNWIGNNISRNSEMFGYFTNGKTDTRSLDFENEAVVTVKPDRNDLHAWIRRAVSKLTIDFDGSGLRDNVSVYIKEARVYDIASGAYLGHYSCVGEVPARKDATPVKGGFDLYAEGSAHVLRYGVGDQPNAWPEVTNKKNLDSFTRDGKTVKFHDETAKCLPFYENMQGGDGSVLKYQDADGDGNIDYPNAGEYEIVDGNRVWKYDEAKDSKPNGTYVEVVGYYESDNGSYNSRGDIKYRFMLGKNVRDNFDCERNHHYKLTLAFKGNGNDADWHIEYDEMHPIELPNPIYISYLYNKSLTFPITINTSGRTLEYLEIEVTKSNWAPYFNDAAPDIDYYAEADKKGDYGKKHPEVGFLSLVKTHDTRIARDGDRIDYVKQNQEYFDKAVSDKKDNLTITRRKRKYLVSPGTHGDEANGTYTVTKDGNVYEFEIPLYTRAKNLIKESAYTGNNPFTGYPREAEITVRAKYKGIEEPVETTTPVYQVRRLVNPKGIHRKADNNTSFHVKLLELEKETSTEFTPLISVGPWKAYVLSGGDQNFISLDGEQEISGETLSEIDFNVNFHGSTPAGKNRFAIIEILYHSYSCVHQIYVSQGEEPVMMHNIKNHDKNTYWHVKNILHRVAEVDNVLDEGSLFRFARSRYPIDASNNVNEFEPWISIKPSDFDVDHSNDDFLIAPGNPEKYTKKKWSDIGSGDPNGEFTLPIDGTSAKTAFIIPDVKDLTDLRDNTEQAYGVLYGDDAIDVQTDLAKAYGYQRDADGKADGTYGMRGCFAYVVADGRHIFFPIGASGYGHRKQGGIHQYGEEEKYNATLRYSAGRIFPYTTETDGNKSDDPMNLPLFYDLYKRPGAIYWLNKAATGVAIGGQTTDANCAGIDVNYFTFDFNYISRGSLYGWKSQSADNSDACFIRCVTRK